MKKIGLIIKREFSTRVRKKSFIILTILGPILMAAVMFLPAYLASLPTDDRVITVLDESLLLDFEKGKDEIRLRYLPPDKFDFASAQAFSEAQGDYAFMHIPLSEGGDPDFVARNVRLFRAGDISVSVESYLENTLEKYLQKEKLKATGVDPEIIARTKTKVNLRVINTDEGLETENATLIKMGIGYVAAFAIYIFIFLYGSQVMRGVIEEKTSRVIEIMVSSVRPFEMMSGKIIGIGLVAMLQFTVWIGLGSLFYVIAVSLFIDPQLAANNLPNAAANISLPDDGLLSIYSSLQSIDFFGIIASFIFYFIFGYLLYAALFAAVGSAVDKESDSQQFMLPISLPLILSLLVIIRALDNPDGDIAFWFSMIPLTSPLVMMARLPFGVAPWELILSMLILLISFVLLTWFASKIYRIGILMYGKKPTFTELLRWARYKN
ncbi:MAG: ABC transporter permease [Bacteroidetes bacterium]|nr:MAG: ABC transporter permease [Bacteroidota bacterium]